MERSGCVHTCGQCGRRESEESVGVKGAGKEVDIVNVAPSADESHW